MLVPDNCRRIETWPTGPRVDRRDDPSNESQGMSPNWLNQQNYPNQLSIRELFLIWQT